MSNVIFGFQVAYEEEPKKHVVDSNKASNDIVATKEKEYKAQLQAEERAKRIQALIDSGEEIPDGMTPEEFLDLADNIKHEEEVPDFSEEREEVIRQAHSEADAIITAANMEASSIIDAANVNGEALKALAREDGHREGYNDGSQKAAMEVAAAKAQMDKEIEAIRQDYVQKEVLMEREVVNICCDMFEKVLNIDMAGNRQVLLHLLDSCLMDIEPTKHMQIKVGEMNVEFVRSKRDEIVAKVGSADVVIDIIPDPLLNESQCIVETDGGLFDCSIDTELEAVIKKIRALI